MICFHSLLLGFSMAEGMHWNAGGWFGGQLGATIWILIAGIPTVLRDPTTGLLVIGLFLIPNLIGLALWIGRKLTCYASTQILIAVSGTCGLATVYLLNRANVWMQIQTGSQVSAQSTYWIIGLLFGGVMLSFYLRFGRVGNGPEA